MSKLLSDFTIGPLDTYRKKASFDWKKLKVFMETEEIIKYKEELYEEIQKNPIFCSQILHTPSVDEQKRLCDHKLFAILNMKQFDVTSPINNLRKPLAALATLTTVDASLGYKHYMMFGMFRSAIQSMGTDRHSTYLEKSGRGAILGAYSITEIGHGSNAKCLQTTATYDKNTQEFILHTPNFEAAKAWAGHLGHMATYAVVYAQLITSDGVNHGVHAFVVKIRDPKTLLPYPRITVGDMGEKIGLNGVDNGTGDVTEDGRYVSAYADPNKRYGVSMGTLSVGRGALVIGSSNYMAHALTIAIRYAAVRKQFGPDDKEELPILEYQTHHYRLFPYLSVAYVVKNFGTYLMMVQVQFTADLIKGEVSAKLDDLGLELHAISSAAKAVSGWVVRDGLQECREACGGHGYLKASGFGDLKNNHDACCTFDGDNHVLIQVPSNWLLKLWSLILRGKTVTSPLQSVDFLTSARRILNNRSNVNTMKDFFTPNNILNMYQWLVCYLLKVSFEKCERLSEHEKLDSFSAKNDSQIFFLKNLGVAYIEHFMLQRMVETISEARDPQIKDVLSRLLSLYGVFSLEKHVATFYQGGYAVGSVFATLLHDSILMLCRSLKDDAVALIDVIAPPDFLIKSVLGRSDGEVYKHLEDAIVAVPGALDRPKWWKEIVDLKNSIKCKL